MAKLQRNEAKKRRKEFEAEAAEDYHDERIVFRTSQTMAGMSIYTPSV